MQPLNFNLTMRWMKRYFRIAFILAILTHLEMVSGGETQALVIPDLFSNGMVIQQEKPVRIWGYGNPEQGVEVEFAGETKSALYEGNRWSLEFPSQKAKGQVLTIKISSEGKLIREITNVVVGEVWLASGQSNMEMQLDMTKEGEKSMQRPPDPLLRSFTVSSQLLAKDSKGGPLGTAWVSAQSDVVGGWSAVGYHFAYAIRQSLKIPVAIIHCSRGGSSTETWCRNEMLQKIPDYEQFFYVKQKDESRGVQLMPSYCYERMLATVIPYSIRGVIWYQGESNTSAWAEQEKLFTAMVEDWRILFGDSNLPFYFVQLARYEQTVWHEFRDVQRKISQSLPHSYMAVTIDLSRESELPYPPKLAHMKYHPIHPATKEPVGERLALAAKALVYGIDREEDYSGPMIKEGLLQEGKIRLNFDFVKSGLKSMDGKPLRGFYIAGDDQKFQIAEATIEGDHLMLSVLGDIKPRYVRYGSELDMGHKELDVNLANQKNLPASPFTLEIKN
jgi:sialate O-acetylesterase